MRFFRKPRGILGLHFGDDAGDSAARLNLHCTEWRPWEGAGAFEACSDMASPVEAFGFPAEVRLLRKDRILEAIELTFRNCAANWDRLRDAVLSEFHLSAPDDTGIYQVWSSGEIVHLERDRRDDTCTLTIGRGEFGRAYREYQLRRGLGALGRSMRPS